MLTNLLKKIVHENGYLSFAEAKSLLRLLLELPDSPQTAALITALSMHSRRNDLDNYIEEMAGILAACRTAMQTIPIDEPVCDIVGTGGDGKKSLNISTGSAILAAACGIPVVKHGNRAVSSACGSADVMESLGYPLTLSSQEIVTQFNQCGFAYAFAPTFHLAFASLRKLRKLLGVPTIFNDLGPLLNPAPVSTVLLGVNQQSKIQLYAKLLHHLHIDNALIFHHAGYDELTTLGITRGLRVKQGEFAEFTINPQTLGFALCQETDLRGGNANYNAERLIDALSGSESAYADCLVLNAGVACFLHGLVTCLEEGILIARATVASGSALKLLEVSCVSAKSA